MKKRFIFLPSAQVFGTLTLIGSMVFLSGCTATGPTNTTEAQKSISVQYDKFNNTTKIETESYLIRKGFTDTFPVTVKYRSTYQDGNPLFIQLYVTVKNTDWGFFHSARGQDGQVIKFLKITKDVEDIKTIGGMVTVDEHFALEFTYSELERLANEDYQIKVYGKKNEGVFTLPSTLSRAFLNKLDCIDKSKSCKSL
jgi:hypothetical protein